MTWITFEAGSTHQGFESAKRLADITKQSGANAIKFQMVDADRLMRDKTALLKYKRMDPFGELEEVSKPLYDILKGYDMTRDELTKLKYYCDEIGITFFCTALFIDQMDFLKTIGCGLVKICSSDINNEELLQHAAACQFFVHLDTGNATTAEIAHAVEILEGCDAVDIVIHHCPSGYPAAESSINLQFIKTLRDAFGWSVAFSDHSSGYAMDIAAVCHGAWFLEKTITEDKTQDGVEHHYSLDEVEAADFVRDIRVLENAIGESHKESHFIDFNGRMIGRRSLTATHTMLPGCAVTPENTEWTRPEVWGSIRPDDKFFYGKKIKQQIQKGSVIMRGDI